MVGRGDDGGVVGGLGVAPEVSQTVVVEGFGGERGIIRISIHGSTGAMSTIWQDGASQDGAGNLQTTGLTGVEASDETDAVFGKVAVDAGIYIAARGDEPGIDLFNIILNVNVARFTHDEVLRDAVDGVVAQIFIS